MRIKSFFFCLHHQILSRRAIFYPWPLKEREGVPLFRLYAVLGTTRPSAIEDKFNFLLSGAFDSYRLSVFWFGTNSLGLGKREEGVSYFHFAGQKYAVLINLFLFLWRFAGQEKMVGIRMFGNLIAEQLKNHKSTPAVLWFLPRTRRVREQLAGWVMVKLNN